MDDVGMNRAEEKTENVSAKALESYDMNDSKVLIDYTSN